MSLNLPIVFVNGVADAAISPQDRGFAYGDGLFETCRYNYGEVPLWELHRERLVLSAIRLKIPLDEHLLARYVEQVLKQLRDAKVVYAVIKITVTRGVGGRGYRLPNTVQPTYCVAVFPCEPLHTERYRNGVSVRICDLRLSHSHSLAGMKHLNRLEHILARSEWEDEFAEGLLLNEQGRLIEATVSNIFVVNDNRLFTPDLSLAGVAGIMRQTIIERLAPALGLSCDIVDIDLNAARAADEIFLCNSVYGIWPVARLVDDRSSADIPPQCFSNPAVTQMLQAQLTQLFRD